MPDLIRPSRTNRVTPTVTVSGIDYNALCDKILNFLRNPYDNPEPTEDEWDTAQANWDDMPCKLAIEKEIENIGNTKLAVSYALAKTFQLATCEDYDMTYNSDLGFGFFTEDIQVETKLGISGTISSTNSNAEMCPIYTRQLQEIEANMSPTIKRVIDELFDGLVAGGYTFEDIVNQTVTTKDLLSFLSSGTKWRVVGAIIFNSKVQAVISDIQGLFRRYNNDIKPQLNNLPED